MGKISFARVDERLVHAQVMMTIVPSSGADSIYVANDEAAQDDFIKMIIESAASRTGMKVNVLTLDEITSEWEENKFGEDRVLLITKTIEDMSYLVKKGLDIEEVNIGGNSEKPGTVRVINEVSINEEQIQLMEKMYQEYGVHSYIQSTPSTIRVELDAAIKKVRNR